MDRIESPEVYDAPVVDQPIQYHEVVRAIQRMKNGKVAGNDQITRELLRAAIERETEGDMVNYLTRIFNLIVDSGEAPEEWCRAIVKPLFKDGDREDWTNYRLVSLTSVVGKLFEAILAHRIERALSEGDLLTTGTLLRARTVRPP